MDAVAAVADINAELFPLSEFSRILKEHRRVERTDRAIRYWIEKGCRMSSGKRKRLKCVIQFGIVHTSLDFYDRLVGRR